MTARKLLRAGGRSSKGPLQIDKKDLEKIDTEEIWAGYNTLDDDFQSMQMAELFYGRYAKPRTVGAGDAMRIIGGVLLYQDRTEIKLGCPVSTKGGRFDSLHFPKDFCTQAKNVNAYGVDPMFAATRLNNDEQEPLLYEPKLGQFKGVFYNTTTELSATNTPYAFYRDEELGGGWDVFLDATASEAAIRRLMWYLRAARYLDGKTKSVTMRIPMHHTKANAIVDLRVKLNFQPDGGIHPDVDLRTIPLDHYFEGSSEKRILFAVDVSIATASLFLCLNSLLNFLLYMLDKKNAKIKRETGVIVRRTFTIGVWDVARETTNFVAPALLVVGYSMRFAFNFRFSEQLSYDSSYRWYDQVSSDARILLPRRRGDAPAPLEGYPLGAFRHQLSRDASEAKTFLDFLQYVDDMGMLYYTYSMVQIPIVMLIVANISRLMGYFEGFFPLMRAMQRSIDPVLMLAVVMLLYCVGCGFALHLVVGDRLETYRTMLSSIEFTGEFQLGEVMGITHA